MGFAQQLEKLSSQPMEEQNLLVKSYNNLKDFIYEKKIEKFYKQVDLSGPKVLRNSPYANDKEVVLKVIEMEHQFRLDRQKLSFADPDQGIEMTPQEEARLLTYGKDRKNQSVMRNLESSIFKLTLRDDLDVGRKASDLLDGVECRFMGEEVLKDLQVAKASIDRADLYQWGSRADLSDFPKLVDNKEFVLHAVSVRPTDLQFASDRLKDDIDVARASHKHWTWDGIEFISDRLKDDIDFAREIITNDGYKLKDFSDRIKDDIHIVHEAVRTTSPKIIHDASPRLQAIAGTENPEEKLQSAINSEKLYNKLEDKLAPSLKTRKMKI